MHARRKPDSVVVAHRLLAQVAGRFDLVNLARNALTARLSLLTTGTIRYNALRRTTNRAEHHQRHREPPHLEDPTREGSEMTALGWAGAGPDKLYRSTGVLTPRLAARRTSSTLTGTCIARGNSGRCVAPALRGQASVRAADKRLSYAARPRSRRLRRTDHRPYVLSFLPRPEGDS